MEAIPQLQAQESLNFANAIAVGTGSLKKGEAQRLIRKWERRARGKQKVNKSLDLKAVAVMHGIGFIEEGK